MGVKRGVGRGGFVTSVLDSLDAFYADVVQHLKPWSAAPPRLRADVVAGDDVPIALASPALSSQDEVADESVEAAGPAPAEEGPTDLPDEIGKDLDDQDDATVLETDPGIWPEHELVAESESDAAAWAASDPPISERAPW